MSPLLALAQVATIAAPPAEVQHRGAQVTVSASAEILETVTNDPRSLPRERQRQVTHGKDRVTVEYF